MDFLKKVTGSFGVSTFIFFVFYRLDALPYVENQVSLYFLKGYIIIYKWPLAIFRGREYQDLYGGSVFSQKRGGSCFSNGRFNNKNI